MPPLDHDEVIARRGALVPARRAAIRRVGGAARRGTPTDMV